MSSETKPITNTRSHSRALKASIADMSNPPDNPSPLTMTELQDLLHHNKVLALLTEPGAEHPRGLATDTAWNLLRETFRTLSVTHEKLQTAPNAAHDERDFDSKLLQLEEKMMNAMQSTVLTIQKTVTDEISKHVNAPIVSPTPKQTSTNSSPWADALKRNLKTTAKLTLSGDQEAIVLTNSLMSKTPTTYRKKNADGTVQYGFTSAEEMASVANRIEEKSNESVKKFVTTPKVTLRNADVSFIGNEVNDRAITDELIINSIVELNSDVRELIESGEKMSVVYFQRHKHNLDEATVGLRVSQKLCDLLLSKGFVHLGHSFSRVVERIFVKQCYKCQALGHLISECKARTPNCFRCGGSHFSRDCTSRTRADMKCINCEHSSNPLTRSSANTHSAASLDCPTIKQFLAKN